MTGTEQFDEPGQFDEPEGKEQGCGLWLLLLGIPLFLLLGCVGICAGIFGWTAYQVYNAPPYKMAMEKVINDPQVKGRLGTPVRVTSHLLSGEINEENDRGNANFGFVVEGPRGEARVHAVAQRIDGEWGLTSLTVTYPNGERQQIDVSDTGGPPEAPRWDPSQSNGGNSATNTGEGPTRNLDVPLVPENIR